MVSLVEFYLGLSESKTVTPLTKIKSGGKIHKYFRHTHSNDRTRGLVHFLEIMMGIC